MKSIQKKDKTFDFTDFEKGLMLAGYISPKSELELSERAELEEYEKQLEKEKSILFFKRSVLAAEITSKLYKEPTFGHVKLQKLMFLCEQVSHMEFNFNYSKQAAGPYDNKFMHSIDSSFENQKWFKIIRVKSGDITIYTYSPSCSYGKHQKYFEKYFSICNDKIQWLINTFGMERTDKVELIATLYACWLELIENNTVVDETNLLSLFYGWSESKLRFPEKMILRAIEWMKTKELFPKTIL